MLDIIDAYHILHLGESSAISARADRDVLAGSTFDPAAGALSSARQSVKA